MSKNVYRILKPQSVGSFEQQADDLFSRLQGLLDDCQVDETAVIQLRFYLSDAANQQQILENRPDYQRISRLGSASSIEQPPLGGEKIAALVWLVKDTEVKREIFPDDDTRVAAITIDNQFAYYLHSIREGRNSECADPLSLTVGSFTRHFHFLAEREMSLRHNCLRTWIFVRDVDRNYAGVVQGRNDVFASQGLTASTHYIASTGIGGASDDKNALVGVDFLSVSNEVAHKIGYLHAPDYLNPTHEYGVAFERGAYIDLLGERFFYISGTASIDKHGECLYRGDVLKQTERLFLNISKLLASGGGKLTDVRYFLVYLRDFADYPAVCDYMSARFPDTPFLITLARVCRPEWLIEVECVAVR